MVRTYILGPSAARRGQQQQKTLRSRARRVEHSARRAILERVLLTSICSGLPARKGERRGSWYFADRTVHQSRSVRFAGPMPENARFGYARSQMMSTHGQTIE